MQVQIVKSTQKAHLVQNSAGQQAWIQARWLKADGSVNEKTFNNGLAYIAETKAQEQSLRDFKNAYHTISIVKEAEKAVAITANIDLIDVERDIQRTVWLPKSQIKDGKAPGWLLIAKRKELMESLGDFSRSGAKEIDYFGGVEF